jgi:hypothetical protein
MKYYFFYLNLRPEPTISFIVFFNNEKLYVTCPLVPFSLILERLREDGIELVISAQQPDGSFSQVDGSIQVWQGAIFRVDQPPRTIVLQKKGEYYVIKGTPLCLDRGKMSIKWLPRSGTQCVLYPSGETHRERGSYIS